MEKIGVLIFLLFLGLNLHATPLFFIEEGVGARGRALGLAHTASVDEIDAVVWNPAGMAQIYEPQLLLEYHNRFIDASGIYAGYGREILPNIYAGGGVYYHTVNGIEVRSADDVLLGEGKVFSSTAVMVSGAWAYSRVLRLGLTSKWIQKSFLNNAANGISFDLGSQYAWHPTHTVSWVLRDIFSPNIGADQLSKTLVLGSAWRPIGHWVLITTDYVFRRIYPGEMNVGVEVSPAYLVSVRAGLQGIQEFDFSVEKLTVGTRLTLSGISVDVSYLSQAYHSVYRASVLLEI